MKNYAFIINSKNKFFNNLNKDIKKKINDSNLYYLNKTSYFTKIIFLDMFLTKEEILKAIKEYIISLDLEGNILFFKDNIPLTKTKLILDFIKYHEKNDNDITSFNIDKSSSIYLIKTKYLKLEIEGKILKLKIDKYKNINNIDFNLIPINDFKSLMLYEDYFQKEIYQKLIKKGVYIISLNSIYISKDVHIGKGTIIYPFSIIQGKTTIGKNCIIGPNTEINDSIIKNNTFISHSVILKSKIGNNNIIGPFAHIKNNSNIKDNIRIGNYVEIKNSYIDKETKIAHLTYIGDTKCGKNVNWGGGSITCNYDGKNKNKTLVEDNAFIGCNTNLIAPIKIGENAFIAAGSTITNSLPPNSFSIARQKQIIKENYISKPKKKE